MCVDGCWGETQFDSENGNTIWRKIQKTRIKGCFVREFAKLNWISCQISSALDVIAIFISQLTI